MGPTTLAVSVRAARADDVRAAAVVAARALHHDPLFVRLAPDPLHRARGQSLFWHGSLRGTVPAGGTSVAVGEDGVCGVASWVPPGRYPLPASAQALQSAAALRALIRTPRAIPLGLRALAAVERVHPKEEHWYLALLSVDPKLQRSGVGTSLVEPALERADADGLPSYLETSNPVNLAWYGRFGFEVVDQLTPFGPTAPVWTMRREPR